MQVSGITLSKPKRTAGLSLVEMLIAVAIASLVFTAVATFTIFMARSFVATGNYADLDRASRNALDILTRDIRMSQSMTPPLRDQQTDPDGV